MNTNNQVFWFYKTIYTRFGRFLNTLEEIFFVLLRGRWPTRVFQRIEYSIEQIIGCSDAYAAVPPELRTSVKGWRRREIVSATKSLLVLVK